MQTPEENYTSIKGVFLSTPHWESQNKLKEVLHQMDIKDVLASMESRADEITEKSHSKEAVVSECKWLFRDVGDLEELILR